MFSIRLLGHSTPPQRPPSPSYVERWLAREGSNNYINQQNAVPQDTLTDDFNYGRAQPTQPCDTGSTESQSSSESSADDTPVDTITGPGSQEEFDEEVMVYYHGLETSMASQFFNLDDQTLACAEQMGVADVESPMTRSSGFSDTVTGGSLEWELEPTSLHLIDMKKFETVIGPDGGKKTTPWPWGDYKYQPRAPSGFLELEEYAVEYQLAEIEKVLREELMEVMAEEAVIDGRREARQRRRRERRERREKRREKRRGKRSGGESEQPVTVTFSDQIVRGRTIYNP